MSTASRRNYWNCFWNIQSLGYPCGTINKTVNIDESKRMMNFWYKFIVLIHLYLVEQNERWGNGLDIDHCLPLRSSASFFSHILQLSLRSMHCEGVIFSSSGEQQCVWNVTSCYYKGVPKANDLKMWGCVCEERANYHVGSKRNEFMSDKIFSPCLTVHPTIFMI